MRERNLTERTLFQNSYFEEEIQHKEKFEKKMMKCTILFSLLMVCASAYEKRGILTEKLHASDEKFCETTEDVKSYVAFSLTGII